MRREKKSSIDDKVTFGQVLELYKEEQRFKALQAEIARLKKELAHESLRADAFNELINVAEK